MKGDIKRDKMNNTYSTSQEIDEEQIKSYLERMLKDCKDEMDFKNCCNQIFGKIMTDQRVGWTTGYRFVNLYLKGDSQPIFAEVRL